MEYKRKSSKAAVLHSAWLSDLHSWRTSCLIYYNSRPNTNIYLCQASQPLHCCFHLSRVDLPVWLRSEARIYLNLMAYQQIFGYVNSKTKQLNIKIQRTTNNQVVHVDRDRLGLLAQQEEAHI